MREIPTRIRAGWWMASALVSAALWVLILGAISEVVAGL